MHNALLASLGGGIALGCRDAWRSYKARRLTLPEHVRNAGFMTDRRVKALSIALITLVVLVYGSLAAFVAWLFAGSHGWLPL